MYVYMYICVCVFVYVFIYICAMVNSWYVSVIFCGHPTMGIP